MPYRQQRDFLGAADKCYTTLIRSRKAPLESYIPLRKLERMACLSLKNAIRLHFDSIILFKHGSFPSALQISILAMEELGKACEVEHYWFHARSDGRMNAKNEQKWLSLLFMHPWKQSAAIARDMFEFSPKFFQYVRDGKLDVMKQKATYVGLRRIGRCIDVNGRIQSPLTMGDTLPRKLISLINDMLLEMCRINLAQEGYFSIEAMDFQIDSDLRTRLRSRWKGRSGIKSARWRKVWWSRIEGNHTKR